MPIENLLTDTERRRLEAQRLLGLAEALLTQESERATREHVREALCAFERLRDTENEAQCRDHFRSASIDAKVG
jgi:hypothetical protein